MGLLKDLSRYIGLAYLDQPDIETQTGAVLDKARLYNRWGKESQKRSDLYTALESFKVVSLSSLSSAEQVLEKLEEEVTCVLTLLRLGLTETARNFNFLCDNRFRMELREVPFPHELNLIMQKFMDEEEKLQQHCDALKKELANHSFTHEKHKNHRKDLLERVEEERASINQGLEAFYDRVRDYVAKDAD